MKLHLQILVALGLGAKRNWHILFAILAGIFVGLVFPAQEYALINNVLFFIGQIFIRLIQMVVVPLVISAIIVGIASLGDSKQLGKIGLKMVLYYGIITVLAVTLGSGLALTLKPGDGVKELINTQSAVEVQAQVAQTIEEQRANISTLFLDMIPTSPIKALADGEMVPIIVFLLIFGVAFALIGDINRPVVSFFESLFAATMKVTDWIMILATPGIFALTASAVGTYGVGVFSSLSKLMLTIGAGLLIQLFVVYPLLTHFFSKVNIFSLYRAVAEAMMVGFGTASSSATLPVTIACCERRAGISNKICSFVLPLGATMSMDATALFQVISVVFLAQAYGLNLDVFTIVQVALLAIIASSTCAGIPGGGLITIAVVLKGLGLTPDQLVEGFALLFALDRIFDMFRTMNNVTSDTVVASVIASNEEEIDYELLSNQEVWKDVV